MSSAIVNIVITVGERAVAKIAKETRTVSVIESSKKTMTDNRESFAAAMAAESEVSAGAEAPGFGGANASARLAISASVDSSCAAASDVRSSDKNEIHFASSDELTFADGTTQIYATQTTTISINGHNAVNSKEVHLGVGSVRNLGKKLTGKVENDRLKKAWLDLLGITEVPTTRRISFKLKLLAAAKPPEKPSKPPVKAIWVRVNKHDPIPEDAYLTGKFNNEPLYIGRADTGEIGKYTVSEGKIELLICHHGGCSTTGKILCIPKQQCTWVTTSKNQPIPRDAFLAGGFYRDNGPLYVGRSFAGEIGKYNITKDGVKMRNLWCPTGGEMHGGEVLCIREN